MGVLGAGGPAPGLGARRGEVRGLTADHAGRARGGEVQGLAAHHAGRARRLGDAGRGAELPRLEPRRRMGLAAGQQREGLGQQGVSGEDGEALAEHHVRGGASSPQGVVVHRRQIVVHERVGVDELDRAGAVPGESPRRVLRELLARIEPVVPGGRAPPPRARRFGRGQGEDGTEALAAGEDAVAHGLRDPRGARGRRGDGGLESGVDLPPAGVEVLVEGDPAGHVPSSSGTAARASGAGCRSPRSVRTSMRRSASSSRV